MNRNRASATLGGMLATTAALGEGEGEGEHIIVWHGRRSCVAAGEGMCDGLW